MVNAAYCVYKRKRDAVMDGPEYDKAADYHISETIKRERDKLAGKRLRGWYNGNRSKEQDPDGGWDFYNKHSLAHFRESHPGTDPGQADNWHKDLTHSVNCAIRTLTRDNAANVETPLCLLSVVDDNRRTRRYIRARALQISREDNPGGHHQIAPLIGLVQSYAYQQASPQLQHDLAVKASNTARGHLGIDETSERMRVARVCVDKALDTLSHTVGSPEWRIAAVRTVDEFASAELTAAESLRTTANRLEARALEMRRRVHRIRSYDEEMVTLRQQSHRVSATASCLKRTAHRAAAAARWGGKEKALDVTHRIVEYVVDDGPTARILSLVSRVFYREVRAATPETYVRFAAVSVEHPPRDQFPIGWACCIVVFTLCALMPTDDRHGNNRRKCAFIRVKPNLGVSEDEGAQLLRGLTSLCEEIARIDGSTNRAAESTTEAARYLYQLAQLPGLPLSRKIEVPRIRRVLLSGDLCRKLCDFCPRLLSLKTEGYPVVQLCRENKDHRDLFLRFRLALQECSWWRRLE